MDKTGERKKAPVESSTPDWEAVEREYRAGIRSLRSIGGEFGVSDAGILKRAKREGWTRDLSAKIKEKALAKVSKAAVSAEVSVQTKIAETQIVEANAQLQADIILSHRKDIRKGRRLVMSLLDEAEEATANRALLEQLGELMAQPDDKGNLDKLNEIYRKVISLPGRTDVVRKLAESLKNLVGLERQAFGLDSRDGDEKPATVFHMQF